MLPVTILYGNVIQMSVWHSVLRGNEWCIKGHDCGHKVKVSTVFGLDCWTRWKGKSKRNDLKEREEDKGSRISR